MSRSFIQSQRYHCISKHLSADKFYVMKAMPLTNSGIYCILTKSIDQLKQPLACKKVSQMFSIVCSYSRKTTKILCGQLNAWCTICRRFNQMLQSSSGQVVHQALSCPQRILFAFLQLMQLRTMSLQVVILLCMKLILLKLTFNKDTHNYC